MDKFQNLTFGPQESLQECINILIVNDTIYEENEVFSVFLVSNDPDVAVWPESATVTIIDEDG